MIDINTSQHERISHEKRKIASNAFFNFYASLEQISTVDDRKEDDITNGKVKVFLISTFIRFRQQISIYDDTKDGHIKNEIYKVMVCSPLVFIYSR